MSDFNKASNPDLMAFVYLLLDQDKGAGCISTPSLSQHSVLFCFAVGFYHKSCLFIRNKGFGFFFFFIKLGVHNKLSSSSPMIQDTELSPINQRRKKASSIRRLFQTKRNHNRSIPLTYVCVCCRMHWCLYFCLMFVFVFVLSCSRRRAVRIDTERRDTGLVMHYECFSKQTGGRREAHVNRDLKLCRIRGTNCCCCDYYAYIRRSRA